MRRERVVPGLVRCSRDVQVRHVPVQHWVERPRLQLLIHAVPGELQRARYVHLRDVRVQCWLGWILVQL